MRRVRRQTEYTMKASLLGTGVVVAGILCLLLFFCLVVVFARVVFG